jgi:hypothetical protein
MRETFIEKKFGLEAQAMIYKINEILRDYREQGYDLSLRQLYYQLVSNNIVPNSEKSYKNIGNLVSDARLSGYIDWDMIKDRGREMVSNPHWDDPAEFMTAVAPQYRFDLWEDQETYVEVMVEKQALEGVLIPVCRGLDVPFTANKGYSSSSALYEASKRFLKAAEQNKELHVIYLGDHDPSGIDMSRDVLDRLNLFINVSLGFQEGEGDLLNVNRVALNMDHIKQLKPPENPAKLTDSRADSYIAKFGRSSWELDAIEPRQLARLVTNAIRAVMDVKKFEKNERKQEQGRNALLKFAKQYKE